VQYFDNTKLKYHTSTTHNFRCDGPSSATPLRWSRRRGVDLSPRTLLSIYRSLCFPLIAGCQ